MNVTVEYWAVIIAFICVVLVLTITIREFFHLPSDAQMEKVREWLLYAVVQAEKELGSGTGKVKLRYVYDLFIDKFPTVAKAITFDMFSNLVDYAVIQMRDMLDKNVNLQMYVEGVNNVEE